MTSPIHSNTSPSFPLEYNISFHKMVEIDESIPIKVHMFYFEEMGLKNAVKQCYVREEVLDRLLNVQKKLPDGIKICILDTWRPLKLQQELYDFYSKDIIKRYNLESMDPVGRQKFISKFVSIPVFDEMRAPVHTTGGAVDLTLIDTDGKPLNMGTDFDDFSEKANTDYYEHHFDREITKNRRLLYNAMTDEGFTNIPSEWWHYDYGDSYWGFYKGKPPFYGGFFDLEILEKTNNSYISHDFLKE